VLNTVAWHEEDGRRVQEWAEELDGRGDDQVGAVPSDKELQHAESGRA